MTTLEAPAEFIEAALDLPIRYIDRSRAYYLALGYDNPAHYELLFKQMNMSTIRG